MQSLLALLLASLVIAVPVDDHSTNAPGTLKEGEVCAWGWVVGPTISDRPKLGECGFGLFCNFIESAADGPSHCRSTAKKVLKDGEVCAYAFAWGPKSPGPRPPLGKCGAGLFCDETLMRSDGPGYCRSTEKKVLKEGEICANAWMPMGPAMPHRPSPGKCGEGLYCDLSAMAGDGPGFCRSTEKKVLKEGEVCAYGWMPMGPPVPNRPKLGKCGPGLFCDEKMMRTDGPGICHKSQEKELKEGEVCAWGWVVGPTISDRPKPGKCGAGLFCNLIESAADGPAHCRRGKAPASDNNSDNDDSNDGDATTPDEQ